MTQSRETIVSIDSSPYYHCIGRCVRRAFLCGKDEFSGKDFEHRRQWIVERIDTLSKVFSIDVCAYAIMSNHYHLVIRLRTQETTEWTEQEVIERWQKIYTGGQLLQLYQTGTTLNTAQKDALSTQIEKWRNRLGDISWFMRCINEYVACKANKEDQCSGRFWEGRFKSQALLDEAALISCMAYVDLNPIRAKMAKTPETSDYTSIQTRIKNTQNPKTPTTNLLEFTGDNAISAGIPIYLKDYLELVDWSGRAIRENKRGSIPSHLAPILKRLNMDETLWLKQANYFGKRTFRVAGSRETLKRFATKVGQQWIQGQGLRNSLL